MPRLSRALLIAAAAASFCAAATGARAEDISVDPNHTTTHFAVKHLLISTVEGTIPVKSVSVTLDANKIPTAITAVMDLTKLDTHNDQRDSDLRSDKFFNVQQYPDMTFKSTKITGSGTNFVMNGDLTVHGVTKPIVVNGTLNGTITDSRGRKHAGYTATATIDRTLWGIGPGYPQEVVANSVTITIEAEAIL
jgi:polyisoprenoid-binding protein YceI